jgi:competence ComEA-like helix-hairpin-helix protein
MSHAPAKQHGSNSILYLALLCLVYYLFTHLPESLIYQPANEVNPSKQIYVQVDDGDVSTVIELGNPGKLMNFTNIYNIDSRLSNGDKVILEGDEGFVDGRISGIKSLSLSIPIGINSAAEEDLTALPGIGETLAGRIVEYREQIGQFSSVGQLLNVNGLGDKKYAAVKNLASLD